MGKALFGTHAAPSTLRLLDEVRSLRRRVAELEAALADAEASGAAAPAGAPRAPDAEDRSATEPEPEPAVR